MKRSRSAPPIASLVVLVVSITICFGLQEPLLPRRVLLESGLMVGGSWLMLPKQPALAARGAAELDFEFYMRDLVDGNKKGGDSQLLLWHHHHHAH
jgi:hypothetical protein